MRIITLSVASSLLLNGVMNLYFYPNLLGYQAGSTMAKKVKEEEIEAGGPVDAEPDISEIVGSDQKTQPLQ